MSNEIDKEFEELDADDEFSTEDLKEMASNEQEQHRVVTGRRASGADVDDGRFAKRSHTTPAQAGRKSQRAQRENPIAWRPASSLEAPPAPRGMVLRWVRDRLGNSEDPKNLSRKMREGWVPYLLKDAPGDYLPPEVGKSSVGETIRVGDLVLCMMPVETYRARTNHYRAKAERQKKATEEKFRSSEDSRLPIEREYRDRSTGPRIPRVQSD
jgi:hypothetical protein